jgi:FO synthase
MKLNKKNMVSSTKLRQNSREYFACNCLYKRNDIMRLNGLLNGSSLLDQLDENGQLHPADVASYCIDADVSALMDAAARLRDKGHGSVVTYSPKVFIPLTQLCRDVCHYCTFAHPPRKGERAFLRPEEVLDIAKAGVQAGCHEALFTLGDKPEKRFRVAREELAQLGFKTTIDYLTFCADLVFEETGLFPHVNPGLMTSRDIGALREVSLSQGIMVESITPRLMGKGGPHYGSPDKAPEARLETIRQAGEASVAFTTGILIGIGETRQERIAALFALRGLHSKYGHL